MRALTATAIGMMMAAAVPVAASDAGWLVRVCPKETAAKQVVVSLSNAEGTVKADVAKYDSQQPAKSEFPVSGPFAKVDSVRIESRATPPDAKASLCIYYADKLVRAITFTDRKDVALTRTETGTACPCKP